MPSKRKVAYYYDPDVGAYTYGLGHLMKPHRMRITHELATVYGMLDKMHVLRPKRATGEDMTAFHTDEYIHFLSNVTPETVEKMTYQRTRFLVGDDNPAWDGIFEFCSISAGGSISAAEKLASGGADIAINWAGGLHHAKKREAAGFCYINDIVLGILELLRTYPRVLYIDIDCHHGDGVEEAFYTSDRVMTCSFHKFGEFFPGTGQQGDIGAGRGKGYSVNVPLKDGITDESWRSVFDPVIQRILDVFRPSAVVLQCGADSLAGDKLGCLNLSMQGHAHCVQFLRDSGVPLILLGGGGYTVKNVARAWTFETACAIGIENEIDLNLPWNQYFEWFGPTYRLEVPENNMEDLNIIDGYLDRVRATALEQLQQLQGPPSVQMHDVPRTSVGDHLGFKKKGYYDKPDELDGELAEHAKYLWDLHHSGDAADGAGEDDTDDGGEDGSDTEASDSDGSSRSNASWRTPLRAASASRGAHHPLANGHGHAHAHGRYGSAPPPPLPSERRRMSILTGKYYDIPVHEEGYSHFDTISGATGLSIHGHSNINGAGVNGVNGANGFSTTTRGTKRRFFMTVDDLVGSVMNTRRDILNGTAANGIGEDSEESDIDEEAEVDIFAPSNDGGDQGKGTYKGVDFERLAGIGVESAQRKEDEEDEDAMMDDRVDIDDEDGDGGEDGDDADDGEDGEDDGGDDGDPDGGDDEEGEIDGDVDDEEGEIEGDGDVDVDDVDVDDEVEEGEIEVEEDGEEVEIEGEGDVGGEFEGDIDPDVEVEADIEGGGRMSVDS